MDNGYVSTRGSATQIDFFQSVLQGIADDGGLLLPAFDLPRVDLTSLRGLSYEALATRIIAAFTPEGTESQIASACAKAYASGSFSEEVVPVVAAGDVHIAELFHGPTAAFKDMALQLLPHLLTLSLKQRGEERRALILAATSGDTGKAALEGFADVEGTMIKVFYPEEGVAPVQRQQMVTQQGKNVEVVAIRGNFDDAQRAVKEAFASESLQRACEKKNIFLTSANSINIGRLVPQIVYYFHAYLQLVAKGVVALGENINVAVPSGNFGNCLAGVMAQRMGLPIRRFIVASNRNNVLTDFFTTGCYDVRRPFHKTIAPAMDILVSSNLERLLSLLSGNNARVAGYMKELRNTGCYQVDGDLLECLHDSFATGWLTDEEIIGTIRDYYHTTGYLSDTHTAVALGVYDRYRQQTADDTPTVVMATASPYKFPASVCKAVTDRDVPEELATEVLWRTTGRPVPEALQDIMDRPVLHNRVIDRNQIVSHIAESIG